MKRLYAARRETLLHSLGEMASDSIKVQATAGLAVVTLLSLRRGHRVARSTVRLGAGSPVTVVHAVSTHGSKTAERWLSVSMLPGYRPADKGRVV